MERGWIDADFNFTCAYCGDVKHTDDQAPDEHKLPCCWVCKREMEPHL